MQPRREPCFPAETRERPEGIKKSVLYGIACIIFIAEETPGNGKHHSAVLPYQLFTAALVAPAYSIKESSFFSFTSRVSAGGLLRGKGIARACGRSTNASIQFESCVHIPTR